jgi:DNA-binding Lrp family transcriptional regulator
MNEEFITAFLFIKVPARRSGDTVDLLHEAYSEIVEAAAVYAETDVVARVFAPKSRVGEILLELLQGKKVLASNNEHGIKDDLPVAFVQPFLVEGNLLETERSSLNDEGSGTIYSYVVINVGENQGTRSKVLQRLRRVEGIIYTAGLLGKLSVLAKVKAPNKAAFDNNIMEQIQSIPGVETTRSLLIINNIHFLRDAPLATSTGISPHVADWANTRR